MYIPKSFTLQSNRFRLRIPNASDIPHIWSATRYEGFNDGMLWEAPNSLQDLEQPLLNSTKAWDEGIGYAFTVVEKEGDELLGRISIRQSNAPGLWNVGFWTHPDQQGQGIMTEVLAEILKFGFEKLSAQNIEACHALWNKGSEKVLKRNGLTFYKYLEKGFQKKGEWVEENLLRISKAAWERSNSPYTLKILSKQDASDYQALRLQSFKESPYAFSESYEDEAKRALASFEKELVVSGNPPEQFILGIYNKQKELYGFVKFRRDKRSKARHKSMIHAMYIAAEYRKKGFGKIILDQLLEQVKKIEGLEQVHLWVLHAGQSSASGFYGNCGFESQGTRVKNDLKIGDQYVDAEYMVMYL